jgi:hypothetical protein
MVEGIDGFGRSKDLKNVVLLDINKKLTYYKEKEKKSFKKFAKYTKIYELISGVKYELSTKSDSNSRMGGLEYLCKWIRVEVIKSHDNRCYWMNRIRDCNVLLRIIHDIKSNPIVVGVVRETDKAEFILSGHFDHSKTEQYWKKYYSHRLNIDHDEVDG